MNIRAAGQLVCLGVGAVLCGVILRSASSFDFLPVAMSGGNAEFAGIGATAGGVAALFLTRYRLLPLGAGLVGVAIIAIAAVVSPQEHIVHSFGIGLTFAALISFAQTKTSQAVVVLSALGGLQFGPLKFASVHRGIAFYTSLSSQPPDWKTVWCAAVVAVSIGTLTLLTTELPLAPPGKSAAVLVVPAIAVVTTQMAGGLTEIVVPILIVAVAWVLRWQGGLVLLAGAASVAMFPPGVMSTAPGLAAAICLLIVGGIVGCRWPFAPLGLFLLALTLIPLGHYDSLFVAAILVVGYVVGSSVPADAPIVVVAAFAPLLVAFEHPMTAGWVGFAPQSAYASSLMIRWTPLLGGWWPFMCVFAYGITAVLIHRSTRGAPTIAV